MDKVIMDIGGDEGIITIEGELKPEGIDWTDIEISSDLFDINERMKDLFDNGVLEVMDEHYNLIFDDSLGNPLIDQKEIVNMLSNAFEKNEDDINRKLEKEFKDRVELEYEYGYAEADLYWVKDLQDELVKDYGLNKKEASILIDEIENWDSLTDEEYNDIINAYLYPVITKKDIEKCRNKDTVSDFMYCLMGDPMDWTENILLSADAMDEKSYVKGTCNTLQKKKEDIIEEYGKKIYDKLYEVYCNLGYTKY